MTIASPDFAPGTTVPVATTCDGDDMSPELNVSGLPQAAMAMAVIMDDPDAPGGTWDHWVVYDAEPVPIIPSGVEDLGVDGVNSWGDRGYGGPCPPRGSGAHRYVFTVLALDSALGLPEGSTKAEVLDAAEGHIIAEGSLVGVYER